MPPSLDDMMIYDAGEKIYNDRFKLNLEITNQGDFFIYDNISKDHIISKDLADGINKMKKKYPGREFYAKKIGYSGIYGFTR